VNALPGDGTTVVFATVGTDHHPFDRLVEWMERWRLDHSQEPVWWLLQNGTSRPSEHARSIEYLAYDDMENAMRRATAVVSHGGPGSIMLASYCGKKPIVVPRRKALGEHVDDHQLVFARRLASEGEIGLAESEQRLRELLDDALAATARERPAPTFDEVARSVQRFQLLIGEMMSRRA
jgi:UDP-N-acetylglucosamine transferase subunit ALG13